MQNNTIKFAEDIYLKYLEIVNGTKFTSREVDVIACLLSARGASKVADLLSISPHTVSSHTRTIMTKIGCNSREGIIDFVEKSEKLYLLREYYSCLVSEFLFKKALKGFSKIDKGEVFSNFRVSCHCKNLKNALLTHLKTHLTLAGFTVEIRAAEAVGKIKNSREQQQIFLLFSKTGDDSSLPKAKGTKFINLEGSNCYYLSVVEILKHLLPMEDIELHFKTFRENYNTQRNSLGLNPLKEPIAEGLTHNKINKAYNFLQFVRKNKIPFAGLMLASCFYFIYAQFTKREEWQNPYDKELPEKTLIRPDSMMPVEYTLLPRHEEMQQLDKKFKGEGGIKTVAIIGPGGAGKTTLARQYAYQQKASVVWELNAETRKSLNASFEKLAQSLTNSEEDHKFLRGLSDINDINKREEKLIDFVSNILKDKSNWFLIYDNIENLADIKKYVPYNLETWGQGKVLLVTRDSTIQTNQHFKKSLQMGELSPSQKLILFTNIINNENGVILTTNEENEAKSFLEKIPSYPLDVAIAAYYLKITNTSYGVYLENLEKNNKDFIDMQKDILKEAGHYENTRYAIITISLQQVVATHKDFIDLLMLISLLDSQNIPRHMMDMFKGSVTVDRLIYCLRKYSLINNHSQSPLGDATFSIHRSTQQIALKYLTNLMNVKQDKKIMSSLSHLLHSYIEILIQKEDLERMDSFITHCEAFLRNASLLTKKARGFLGVDLGQMYFTTGNYAHAKKTLEESISLLNKEDYESKCKFAKALVFLGNIEREFGNYTKAIELVEESLQIYKQHLPEKPVDIAFALSSLGNIYRSSGENDKAKTSLEEALALYRKRPSDNQMCGALALGYLGIVEMELGNNEKGKNCLEESVAIYKNLLPENHVKIAWATGNLAKVYTELADYQKAKALLEQTLVIYTKNFPENHDKIGWALAHLGNVCSELGEHEKAKGMLEKSLNIHKKCFHETHPKIGWVSLELGRVSLQLRDYERAKKLFGDSLAIYTKAFTGEHVLIAGVLQSLGKAHLLTNDFANAEKFLNQAISLYSQENYIDIYIPLESLSDLYLKKATQATGEGKQQQAQDFKNQATNYLNQALKVVTDRYPKHSPHLKRIEEKLKFLSK